MPQDRKSGAIANRWGRETARKIILLLRGEPLSNRNNECEIRGKQFIVKCAKPNTKEVEVSYTTLKRIHAVIGAFALDDHKFDLFLLTTSQYKKI